MSEMQANGLIDLVIAGEDPNEIMQNTIAQIHEGSGGGPYPIGSTVNINQSYTAETTDGKSVSLKQGDVVSIVAPNMGEDGQDKMVLLSDGATKAIVPLKVLGENIEEAAMVHVGPAGHEVPPKTGQSAAKDSTVIGDPAPKDVPEPKAQKQPSSHPAAAQDDPAPKDDKSAQKPGQSAPAAMGGKAVESIVSELEKGLEGLDEDDTLRLTHVIAQVQDASDEAMIEAVFGAVFGDKTHTIEDLEKMIEAYGNSCPDKDKKKKPFGGMPFMKKKEEMAGVHPAKPAKAMPKDTDKNMPPGKNKAAPGIKEEESKAVFTNLFERFDN
jgi:hypothetical protein